MIGIYSINRYEYDAVVMGGYHQNVANVALYDTLGAQAVNFIIDQTEIKVFLLTDLQSLSIACRNSI